MSEPTDYLLDTCIVSRYASHDPTVLRHVNALDRSRTRLWISAITLGEIEFGHEKNESDDPDRRDEYERFIIREFRSRDLVVEVTRHTAYHYGPLRAAIFRKYPPKGKKQKRPEQCSYPVTATDLAIEENDLWIAAQAIERQYVLVTHDSMARIREAVGCQTDVIDWAAERPTQS